jgi:hypothetical protein
VTRRGNIGVGIQILCTQCSATLLGNSFKSGVVVVNRQADLLKVIAAAHPSSRFACGLNGWQKQANQDTNDGDDNQQLDQSKPGSP